MSCKGLELKAFELFQLKVLPELMSLSGHVMDYKVLIRS